jgi:hypothetical protein
VGRAQGFEIGSHPISQAGLALVTYVAQVSLELLILLPQTSECWDYR